jgi:hypothetical protein
MVSSGMLHRVALVRTDVPEEPSASFVEANVVPSSPILVTLMEALSSSVTPVLKKPHGVTSHKTLFFSVTEPTLGGGREYLHRSFESCR